jgi:hypothetical protein
MRALAMQKVYKPVNGIQVRMKCRNNNFKEEESLEKMPQTLIC